MVAARPPRHRDAYQAYYTKEPAIVDYMVSRLRAQPGDVVWEPCAGEGDLVDAVLEDTPGVRVRASEVRPEAAEFLRRKYASHPNVQVICEDALDFSRTSLFTEHRQVTRVIANPPYGAWQSPERRADLKRRFPELYVRETYSTIMFHAFEQLEAGGRLVFLVPDTFLWLHRHERLRRSLLEGGAVEEAILFPSRFFPGASFSYSGMCILTVSKVKRPGHRARIISDIQSPDFLSRAAAGRLPAECSVREERQSAVLSRTYAEFLAPASPVAPPSRTKRVILLGDAAEIRTGFYSGDDRAWLRRASASVPRSACYRDVDLLAVRAPSDDLPPLTGIRGPRHFIPIVRGGAAPFHKPDQWYVDWSERAVTEYTRPGRNPARFQNARFYFREGIAVPMVASSRLTAAPLRRRIFDQGIVGVFPIEEVYCSYLLGFLNSKAATALIRQINPTANNSANYLKRLPLILPGLPALEEVDAIVRSICLEAQERGRVSEPSQIKLDQFFDALFRDSATAAETRAAAGV